MSLLDKWQRYKGLPRSDRSCVLRALILLPLVSKSLQPLEDKQAFQTQAVPLGVIYILGPRAAIPQAPFVERLTPLQAFMELVQNTYMNFLLTRETRAAEFLFLSHLVDAVPVRRITPHADPARLGQLCNCILRDIAEDADGRIPHSPAIVSS